MKNMYNFAYMLYVCSQGILLLWVCHDVFMTNRSSLISSSTAHPVPSLPSWISLSYCPSHLTYKYDTLIVTHPLDCVNKIYLLLFCQL